MAESTSEVLPVDWLLTLIIREMEKLSVKDFDNSIYMEMTSDQKMPLEVHARYLRIKS